MPSQPTARGFWHSARNAPTRFLDHLIGGALKRYLVALSRVPPALAANVVRERDPLNVQPLPVVVIGSDEMMSSTSHVHVNQGIPDGGPPLFRELIAGLQCLVGKHDTFELRAEGAKEPSKQLSQAFILLAFAVATFALSPGFPFF